jgi:heme exporter protein D
MCFLPDSYTDVLNVPAIYNYGIFQYLSVMTGISMVFLVVLLLVKRPRQAQIRRKSYKSRKKHQDRVQDAKRQEKAKKVKKMSIPS